MPSPGAERTTTVPPARSTRPRIDSASPWRSFPTASGSNPTPRSRTNNSTRSGSASRKTSIVSTLRVASRVHDRLAAGGDQRRATRRRRGASPDETTSTRTWWSSSTAASSRRSSAATDSLGDGAAGLEQPRPQLAFLASRHRPDLARVIGAALNQRERLQHAVVQMRGEVGALLVADAFASFEGEVGREPSEPRPGQEGDARDQHECAERALSDVAPPAGHTGADRAADRDERGAECDPHRPTGVNAVRAPIHRVRRRARRPRQPRAPAAQRCRRPSNRGIDRPSRSQRRWRAAPRCRWRRRDAVARGGSSLSSSDSHNTPYTTTPDTAA